MNIAIEPTLKAVAALLLAGTALLALFSLLPRTAPHARPLWPTLLTELVIASAAGLSFWLGGPFLLAALLALAGRVGYEAAGVALGRLEPGRPASGTGPVQAGLALAALCLAATLPPLHSTVLAAGVAVVVLSPLLLARRNLRDTLPNAAIEFLLFPAVPTVVFVAVASRPEFGGLMLLIFLLVETFDSYALFGGKLFGRTLAFPRLSPRKTIEGLACGAAGLALTAGALGPLLYGIPVAASMAGALGIGLLATAGDLAASRLKRIAGVKDYPFLMPRQGGLFDIVDAWLMTGAGIALALAVWGRI